MKPERIVSFTTNEGSYMNIDVSPDGKTLLFDLLGDVYSVSSKGGHATQLTNNIGLNLRPMWSLSGDSFAYISDISDGFNFHVRDFGSGKDTLIGKCFKDQDIAWSQVLGATNVPKNELLYLPKNKTVYFEDSGKLFSLNYVTNDKKFICEFPFNYARGYLSPDNRWWAYVKDTNGTSALLVYDLNKASKKILIPSLLKKPYSYKASVPRAHFSFSPDSKSIFIGYGGKIHQVFVSDGTDRVIPFVANVKSHQGYFVYNTFQITHESVSVRYIRSTNRSADGKHLVFSALNKIYVVDPPNGKPRKLADDTINQFQPVFSPDGKWIVYVTWSDTKGGQVCIASIISSGLRQLTTISGHYERPTWSPDGKYIAVVRGENKLNDRDDEGSGKLLLISVSDGSTKVVDDAVPLWNNIQFSNDGTRLIYQPKYKQNEGNLAGALLVSKGIADSTNQVLLRGEEDRYLQQRSVSPDGRFLVYSACEDIYLLPLKDSLTLRTIGAKSRIKISAGVDPFWENGGKTLSWTYCNKFFSADPDKIIESIKVSNSKINSDQRTVATNFKVDHIIEVQLTTPASYGRGLIALKNVRIITMKGNEVIERGTIVVKDGRIIAIGSIAFVKIPVGAKVLDLNGTTIIPGLIDTHLHTRLSPNIFPQQSWVFLASLAYGVTTFRDPSLNFDSFGYTELLRNGSMIGPRLYSVGRPARLGDGLIECDNLNDARALVQKRKQMGGTVIKQYELPTRKKRQWLTIACREAGLNVTNEGDYEPLQQFAMIKDGSTGVEHNPVWGDVYDDVIKYVARSGTYFTPALQVTYGTEEGKEYMNYKYWHRADEKMKRFIRSDESRNSMGSNGNESLESVLNAKPKDTIEPGFLAPARINARMIKQGANVALGSHGNNPGIGAHNELWALQTGGITNMQALQAATITGAKALGVQKDLGSLEVGKIADLIILNKNPLDDIHNSREIRYVMKDGVLYDGDTLDQIWPEKKKCPEWKNKGEIK